MDYSELLESASLYLNVDLNASLSSTVNTYSAEIQATLSDDTLTIGLSFEDRAFEFTYELEESVLLSSYAFATPEESYAYYSICFLLMQALVHAADMADSNIMEGIMSSERGLFSIDDAQASLEIDLEELFAGVDE